ncbi:MAG: hypothetical protein ACK5NG_06295 [Chthoniobacterales bacterium]
MSNEDLKSKILDADPTELRGRSKDVEPDYEAESRKHNHALRKVAKDEFSLWIPWVVKILLLAALLASVALCLFAGRYLCLIWSDTAKIEQLLITVGYSIVSFIFGTLLTIVFKNKH